VPLKNNIVAILSNPDFLPVIKDNSIFYGGSQMWFSSKHRYSKDYILHNYGCGTIATADMFLYLATQNKALQTPLTAVAISGNDSILQQPNKEYRKEINYPNYTSYVRLINKQYTRTLPIIAVTGPAIASAVNSYSDFYALGLKANWKYKLGYYDMYDLIEEMLQDDIPVILSIGPNTPKLWGKKGIPFYELCEINFREPDPDSSNDEAAKPYYYKAVKQDVNAHYVTVTGLIKDDISNRIMLRISSWGKQYYINYEEYRDYVDNTGGTFTSSLLYVRKR
jgi:hypothetical protein